jgi:enolase
MDAHELNEQERLALMGLLRLTISADVTLSQGESQQLKRIAADMGQDAFREARDTAKGRLQTRSDVEQALRAVERSAARSLIYRYALDAARSDELIAAELEVLRWVAELWALTVDPESGEPS